MGLCLRSVRLPATGVVKVEKYTVVLDPGIVVNPEQLKRQVEGGAVMGISIALHEEVNFNRECHNHCQLVFLSHSHHG